MNSFFIEFLKSKNITGEVRISVLAENLEKLAPFDDDLKIQIIKQAIAGGHPDFRPIPATKEKGATPVELANMMAKKFGVSSYNEYGSMSPSEIRGIHRYIPDYRTIEEFFIKNGGDRSQAEQFFEVTGSRDWPYSRELQIDSKNRTSTWREIALKYYIPNPPSKGEVVEFFKVNGYNEDSASEFYQTATDRHWKNQLGEDVAINLRWQRTAEGHFFKPENRIKDEDLTF